MKTTSHLASALLALGILGATANAQTSLPNIGNEIGRIEAIQLDSGAHTNLSELASLVWEYRVQRPAASFLQLEFDQFELPEGSWVELTSMKDMDIEVLDAESLARTQRMSAYFNGGDLRIRLFAGPLTRETRVSFKSLGVGHPHAALAPMTICGTSDNRARSSDARVARIIMRYSDNTISWCTAWLIDPQNCFVSAGHCMANKSTSVTLSTVTAQFNVPLSSSTGGLVNPSSSHQYVWLGSSSTYRRWENQGEGKDWSVFKVNKNSVTDRFPGYVQGDYFPISTVLPAVDSTLRITGHGGDSSPQTYNAVQQTHTGPYKGRTSNTDIIRYRVDTEGGNSGSPVIKVVGSTEYAIGVHTHGGCGSSSSSSNAGTYSGRSLFVTHRDQILNSGLCDLEAVSVGVSQSTLAPLSVFTVSSTIRNVGQIAVPETTTSSYYISTNTTVSTSDTLLGSFTTNELAINASQFHSMSVQIPSGYGAGTRYVGVLADRIYKLPETSESNNTAYRTVTVVGTLGDLTPSFLSTSATNLYPNLPFTMQGRVNNVGSASTPSVASSFVLSTNDIISTADTLLASWTTPALTVGNSHLHSVGVTAPSSLANADYWLGILTDRNGVVTELNEDNNTRSLKVRGNTTGTPDYQITSVVPDSTTITGGGTVSVTTTTRNTGTAPGTGTSYTGIFLSTNTTISTADYYLGSHSVSALGINASLPVKTTQTVPACPTTGTYYLGAYADFTGVISESSEGNNTGYATVNLTGTRSTLVQWRPLYNTIATNETSASVTTSAGGTGNMCVIAPSLPTHFYLVTWGGTGGSGSGWTYSPLTDFALALTNGPLMPLWLGQVDSSGRGYPRLVIPSGGPAIATFYAYTRVWFFTPSFTAISGFTTNTHYVRVAR